MIEINPTTLGAEPFFKGLAQRHLELLVNDAMLVKFKSGEQIFCEGDPANRFYLLTAGKVALESTPDEHAADDEEPVPIETLGPGSVLGWSWLFPPYLWHFDARAITPVKAMFFYGTRLREQCENDHELGYELMKRINEIVINRLQATRQRMMKQSILN
jgi:CRP-like cAMP-binding protein